MPYKIRIFQPVVPEYRKALFDGLGKHYGNRLEIWAAADFRNDQSCPLECARYDYHHPMKSVGPFVWQKGLTLKGLKEGDVVVVSGDIHQLSTVWIAFRAKCRGIKVVWWGHHRSATSADWAVAVRLWIARRLSDVYLAYTRTGVRYLETVGFKPGRVFATGNTIDQTQIKEAIRVTKVAPSTHPLLLCCGVLRDKVHLELVIQALADERMKDFELAVIGDGPMKARWQKLATDLGVADRVVWVSGTRDQFVMAPWFLKAKAFVYPGVIGLSILHSFSYGLPVITHCNADHQGPEFEVMEDGQTGVCFKEGDLEDLIVQAVGFLEDEVRRKNSGRYCQDVAFNLYSMDQMITNFCRAIAGAVES